MKNILQTIITTTLIIVVFFGYGIFLMPNSFFTYHTITLILATVTMFETQPKLKREDFNSPSDKFSMLGIAIVSILINNLNIIVWIYTQGLFKPISFLNLLGFVMIWTGLAFRIYAINRLGRFFKVVVETQNDHDLCDKDIYSLIRHPSYTGAIITIVGTVFWLGSFYVLPYTILLLWGAYYYRIIQEERALVNHFGERYKQYAQKTGALFPKMLVLKAFLKKVIKYFTKK